MLVFWGLSWLLRRDVNRGAGRLRSVRHFPWRQGNTKMETYHDIVLHAMDFRSQRCSCSQGTYTRFMRWAAHWFASNTPSVQ